MLDSNRSAAGLSNKGAILWLCVEIHIEFLCDRTYLDGMRTLSAMALSDVRVAMDTPRKQPVDQQQERWSDCWPDWNTSVEDAEVIKAQAEMNAPRVVFAEIGRVLAVILIAIVAIDIALGAFHIH